jgi:hypothetical protein
MNGYDSDIGDLVESIHTSYDDEENALNLMKALVDKFKSNELEIATRKYATDNNLCYDCECEMEVEEWSERRPYGDTYASEFFAKKVCPECGIECEEEF